MLNLRKILFRERRQEERPVSVERRRPRSIREAKERLQEAHDSLQRMLREKNKVEFVSNDPQQEVQFKTFRMICKDRLEMGDHRLCRHPKHEAANTGIAKCEETLCPFILGKIA